MLKKAGKAVILVLINFLWFFRPRWSTALFTAFLRRSGVQLSGTPNYISARVWFDGSDYSQIILGDGVTISSNVRILTHDWSPHTVRKAWNDFSAEPLGKFGSVTIGDFSFIGTGAILMPGCTIGRGVIVGAGAVVRGTIEDYAIVIGNPSKVIGDSREYVARVGQSAS